ncbi:transcriptional regulator [Sphingomonas sp. IW22]|uniref:transcriptional regulator n=1 Tax=Sphingomonas sp. IW22 TaxID=3242489 RepID=UPI0035210BCB
MDAESTQVVALRSAVERAGGQTALSRLLSVTQQAVSKWLRNGKPLPAEHVLAVEAATGVSRHDLRPDIYPRDLAPIDPAEALRA